MLRYITYIIKVNFTRFFVLFSMWLLKNFKLHMEFAFVAYISFEKLCPKEVIVLIYICLLLKT